MLGLTSYPPFTFHIGFTACGSDCIYWMVNHTSTSLSPATALRCSDRAFGCATSKRQLWSAQSSGARVLRLLPSKGMPTWNVTSLSLTRLIKLQSIIPIVVGKKRTKEQSSWETLRLLEAISSVCFYCMLIVYGLPFWTNGVGMCWVL